jgi:hypothetical protein
MKNESNLTVAITKTLVKDSILSVQKTAKIIDQKVSMHCLNISQQLTA